MTHIRIIGDIHGFLTSRTGERNYLDLISPTKYSVQVGDHGFNDFDDKYLGVMESVDPTRHRIILGNHDRYDRKLPHHLGDFGVHSFPLMNGSFEFFYIRGGYSIDKDTRIVGVSWWPEEELTWDQGSAAVSLYSTTKPKIMMSHECPEEICYLLGIHCRPSRFVDSYRPSRTAQILQACFESHKPDLWVFGHHHQNFRSDYKGTTFIGLDGQLPWGGHRVGYIDFDYHGKLLTTNPK